MSQLIRLIHENYDKDPNKIILRDSKKNWTWYDLLNRAKCYSESIITNSPNQKIVPILVDRSGESVAAMLGCILLKKGIAPLSPNQPIARIEKSVNKLDTTIVLSAFETNLKLTDKNIIFPNHVLIENKIQYDKKNFNNEDILYNLFTSGSTGDPKGVMVSSANIENTMLWSIDIINWNNNDVIGCATNFYFDISMFDLFTMLYFNIPIAIFSETINISKVVQEIKKYNVTSIFSVPLFFAQLLKVDIIDNYDKFNSLKRILSGGDFFHPNQIIEWLKTFPSVEIYNVWGPTETSIVNTMHLINVKDLEKLKRGESPSVGKAHSRMRFYIVNDDRSKIINKSEERGEIVMIGESVTQGYLKDDLLTSQSYGVINGERCFYTNDIGYINSEGSLFIIGRKGTTIKLSGYRVDLSEIEFIATNYDKIQYAISFVNKVDKSNDELCLAVELKNNNETIDLFDFKKYLRESLPHYMVPKKIFFLEEMPKNSNGKIDRNKININFFNE